MKIEEAFEILQRCPYYFEEEEIEFNTYERVYGRHTLAEYWIMKYKTAPPSAICYDSIDLCVFWIRECESVPPYQIRRDVYEYDTFGYTCAMRWIQYVKKDIPPLLRHNPDIVSTNDDICFQLWLKQVRTTPPQYLIPTNDENKFRCAHTWCVLMKTPIPDYLIPNNDKYKYELAKYWLLFLDSLPPPYLYHNTSYKVKDRDTNLGMAWIYRYKSLPPEQFREDPNFRNWLGETCAMIWLRYCVDPLPTELYHDPTIKNYYGETLAMKWISKLHTIPPSSLLHDPSIKNNNGHTCASYWNIYVKTPVPECLLVH